MKSKAIRFGPGIVAGLTLTGAAVAQNLVLNGSFEEGYQGEFQRPIPQWISGGTGDVYLLRGHGSSAGLTSANFSGYYSSVAGSTLSQTFATIPGETYSVSFDAYAIRYAGGTSTLRADVTGLTPRFSNTFVLRSNGNSPFFEALSFTFEADSIATTLTFTDGGATEAIDPVLDNVVVLGSQYRLYGHAYLDGYLASVVGELLEVEVWQNNSVVETLDGDYGPNGTFAFSPTVNGTAVLRFRFRTGLWKAVPVTLGPTPIENLTVNMTNGDCDHDNEVGIGDYALLSAIYGLSVGDPGFDTNADLNGDTTVDIADYAILSGSYGETGD